MVYANDESQLEARGKAIDVLPRFGKQEDGEVEQYSGMKGISDTELEAQMKALQAELGRRRAV